MKKQSEKMEKKKKGKITNQEKKLPQKMSITQFTNESKLMRFIEGKPPFTHIFSAPLKKQSRERPGHRVSVTLT